MPALGPTGKHSLPALATGIGKMNVSADCDADHSLVASKVRLKHNYL